MPDRPLQGPDDDDDDDDDDEEEEDDQQQFPLLQVVLEPDAADILGIPPEERPEEPNDAMEDVEIEDGGSPQGEESMVETGDSSKEERPAFPYADSPEARYGNFIASQLTRQQEQLLRQWTVAMSGFVGDEEEAQAPVPRTLEGITTFQLASDD